MAFVKLDTGILNSTLWIERDQREVFITALLMAEPREFEQPTRQIRVGELEFTDFEAPPGWYGFVPAASVGIIRRAGVDHEAGMEALRRMGDPDIESRSKEFEGRRMIRVDGGFLILNYMKYRDKDHTAAIRQQRLRDRKKALQAVTEALPRVTRDEEESQRDDTLRSRNITQSEAEAEEEADTDTKAEGGKRQPVPRQISSLRCSDAGSELMAANWLLEELGVVADNGVRRVAADSIRLLAREGGTVQSATEYILEAGKGARESGEVITRFWFTDQRYRPQGPRKSERQKRIETWEPSE